MLRVIVLGAAAGGGLPQWNCGCFNCAAARAGRLSQSTQVAVAFSGNDRDWVLINASPDLRHQINMTPQLTPAAGESRQSPIVGVILTNAEIDAVVGLLSMREGSPFAIYAHKQVLDVLQSNSVFGVLDADKVQRIEISPGVTFEPVARGSSCGLRITPFEAPGKPAWYQENAHRECDGHTLGVRVEDTLSGKSICVVTACARVTDDLKTRVADCDILFFDGTLWRDDEMIAAGLGQKTGQRMGHIAMDGPDGAIASLGDVNARRKVFVHLNNSNPVWHASAEREAAGRAGWEIGYDGMEFTL